TRSPAEVDAHVAALSPAQFRQSLRERHDPGLRLRIVRSQVHQHADAPHPLWLLRTRRERPPGCRAAEQRDEVTPLHSITSSARRRNDSGIVRSSALAVLRLITSSNLVGCSTGMSPGLAPRKILST